MEIVINRCFGGFSVNRAAMWWLYQHGANVELVEENGSDESFYPEIERNDPLLVQCVRELGESAGGRYAELKIVVVPDDAEWQIDDYDGMETIHEVHRVWY